MTYRCRFVYRHNMPADPDARNDRDRRSGQTYSFYLHFDEKDALDAEAADRETTPNAVLRDLLRSSLGL